MSPWVTFDCFRLILGCFSDEGLRAQLAQTIMASASSLSLKSFMRSITNFNET